MSCSGCCQYFLILPRLTPNSPTSVPCLWLDNLIYWFVSHWSRNLNKRRDSSKCVTLLTNCHKSMSGHIQTHLHKHTQIAEVINYSKRIEDSQLYMQCCWSPKKVKCIKMEPRMEDLVNKISLLMSILTHIRLSGQCVHSRDSVSFVTYANLVLPSEMHESLPIIVINYRTLLLGVKCLTPTLWLQLAQSEKKTRQVASITL